MPEAFEEEVMDIEDARIPEAIRAHARRFCTHVRYVVYLGGGEYVLSAEDGEVVDLVFYPPP